MARKLSYDINFRADFDAGKVMTAIRQLKSALADLNIEDRIKEAYYKKLSRATSITESLTEYRGKENFSPAEFRDYGKRVREIYKELDFFRQKDWSAYEFISPQDKKDIREMQEYLARLNEEIDNFQNSIRQESGLTSFEKRHQSLRNYIRDLEQAMTMEQRMGVAAKEKSGYVGIRDLALQKRRDFFESQAGLLSPLSGGDVNKDFLESLFGVSVPRTKIEAIKKSLKIDDEKEKIERLAETISEIYQKKPLPDGHPLREINQELEFATQKIAVLESALRSVAEYESMLESSGPILEERKRERDTKQFELTEKMQVASTTNIEKAKVIEAKAGLAGAVVGEYKQRVDDAAASAERASAVNAAYANTFGGLISRIQSVTTALFILRKTWQMVADASQMITNLDRAFTDIAIVTGKSRSSIWGMFDDYNTLAKSYSVTMQDLAEGAKIFYQQGLNASDTMKMVEASTVSAALGGVSMAKAADMLTAAIRGYSVEADQAMAFTDKIAAVGAESAADFTELANAMEKVASSAATTGVDFDHLLGYLSKMIEVTREAPANLGTSMKTLLSRINELKENPTKILEDGIDANRVEKALKTVGIAFRDLQGNFRPTQDILDELGGKWETLDRNTKAYLATIIASSRQQSRFLALMNDYERTLELVAVAQDSAGTAAEQYMIYQDSIGAASNRLSVAWDKLYKKMLSPDFIIKWKNSTAEFLEVLEKIPPQLTVIGALSAAGGLHRFFGMFSEEKVQNFFTVALRESGAMRTMAKTISLVNQPMAQFLAAKEKFIAGRESLTSEMEKVAAGATKTAAAFPWVTAAILATTAAIWGINKALNYSKDKLNEQAGDILRASKRLDEYTDKIETLSKLLDKYDELASKIALTASQQEELNNVIGDIAKHSDQAIISIDNQRLKHIENKDAIVEEVQALKDLEKARRIEKNERILEIIDTVTEKTWDKDQTKELFPSLATAFQQLEDARKEFNRTGLGKETFSIVQFTDHLQEYTALKDEISNIIDPMEGLGGALDQLALVENAQVEILKIVKEGYDARKEISVADLIGTAYEEHAERLVPLMEALRARGVILGQNLDNAEEMVERLRNIEKKKAFWENANLQSEILDEKALAFTRKIVFEPEVEIPYEKREEILEAFKTGINNILDSEDGVEWIGKLEKIFNDIDPDFSGLFRQMENEGIVLGEVFKNALQSAIGDEKGIFEDTLSKFDGVWAELPRDIRQNTIKEFFKNNVTKEEIKRFNEEISQLQESQWDNFYKEFLETQGITRRAENIDFVTTASDELIKIWEDVYDEVLAKVGNAELAEKIVNLTLSKEDILNAIDKRRRTIPEVIKHGLQPLDVSQSITAEDLSTLFTDVPDLDINKFKMAADGRFQVERDMQLRLRQLQKEENLKMIQEQIDAVEAQIYILEKAKGASKDLTPDQERQLQLHRQDLQTLQAIREQYESLSTIPSATIEIEARLNLNKTFSVIELKKLAEEQGLDLDKLLTEVIATPDGFKLDEGAKARIGAQIADSLRDSLAFAQAQLEQANQDFASGAITQEQFDSYKSIAEQTEKDYNFATKLNWELEHRVALETSLKNLKTAQAALTAQPASALSEEQIALIGEKLMQPYISINAQGEKYLSTLGRILLLTESYKDTLANQALEYATITQKIEEQEALLSQQSDTLSDQSSIIRNKITALEAERDILEEQQTITERILSYRERALALTSNVSQAQEAADRLRVLEEAQEQVDKLGNGLITLDMFRQIQEFGDQMGFITHEFLDLEEVAGTSMVRITEGSLERMKDAVKEEYRVWLAAERNKITQKIAVEQKIVESLRDVQVRLNKGEIDAEKAKEETLLALERASQEDIVDQQKSGLDAGLAQQESFLNSYVDGYASAFEMVRKMYSQLIDIITSGKRGGKIASIPVKLAPVQSSSIEQIESQLQSIIDSTGVTEQQALDQYLDNVINQHQGIIQGLQNSLNDLKYIDPDAVNQLTNALNASGGAAGRAGKEITAFLDAAEKAVEIVTNLNEMLKEFNRTLRNTTIDYKPFLDRFKEWEKEWAKFYNIRRLMDQIGSEGSYIDNLIASTATSGDRLVEAYKGKIGNIVAQMSATNGFILMLRKEMSELAVKMKDLYGDYFQVDPQTNQIYRNNEALKQINETINNQNKLIYDLNKKKSDLENDKTFAEGLVSVAEKEYSDLKKVQDTLKKQIKDLKDERQRFIRDMEKEGLDPQPYLEDANTKIAELERVFGNIGITLDLKEKSVDEMKDEVQKIKDEISKLDIKIAIEQGVYEDLQKYVQDMEKIVGEYEGYYKELIDKISGQQIKADELVKLQSAFVQSAIDVQSQLYNAIVESYQKEINQKKKQYEELKKLDQEYLRNVKKSIEEERKIRKQAQTEEDRTKRVQRAQLLEMDTSGAYRGELASLRNQIEDDRTARYDEQVDARIESLEREVNKRAELYDREVAALEQRLAYYQEHAILLWEEVNLIFANGASAITQTLENTAAFMNQNELQKMTQRETWERNVAMSIEGVTNHMITTLDKLIEVANSSIIKNYPEIDKSLKDYSKVFDDAAQTVKDNTAVISNVTTTIETKAQLFSVIMDTYLAEWQSRTHLLTGYADTWAETMAQLRAGTKENLESLKTTVQHGIDDLEKTLKESAEGMYQDTLAMRQEFIDAFKEKIREMGKELSEAVNEAAQAIANAVNAIRVPVPGSEGGGGGSGGTGNQGGEYGGGVGSPPLRPIPEKSDNLDNLKKRRYRLTADIKDAYGNLTPLSQVLVGKGDNAYDQRLIEGIYKQWERKYNTRYSKLVNFKIHKYEKGGLANRAGLAWLDGTKQNPERILSAKQTKLFESMVLSLERQSLGNPTGTQTNYTFGDIKPTIVVEKLMSDADIEKAAKLAKKEIVEIVSGKSSFPASRGR